MSRRPITLHLGVGLLLVGSLLLGACGTDDPDTVSSGTTATTNPAMNEPTDSFYVAPDPLPAGEPGDVIRSEPLSGAPAGSQAWKVLYLSEGVDGGRTAVSGIIVAPVAAPSGATGTTAVVASDRPVLSWAHPTTGVVDTCAPSTMADVFALIPGLDQFLAAGYVVAATDYEGLGTEGVHPYLIGESEGRSVLDAARAARNLPETGAGEQLLLWGHSQGGQASLFAGEMAPTYAPELELVATAAAAPAGELAELLNLDADTLDGVILGAYAVNAFVDIYADTTPAPSEGQVVTPEGLAAIAPLVQLCDLTQSAQMEAIANPLVGKFFVGDPSTVDPWGALLTENSAGERPIESPVFIAQGDADIVVVPATTAQLAATYCTNGTDVTEKVYPGVSHDLIGYASAADVAAWMGQVLAGNAPPGTCPPR